MQKQLIKLKLTEQAKEKGQGRIIHEKFIEACTHLDASIIEPFIDEDQIFEDVDKYRFLDSLKQNLDLAKEAGAEMTTLRNGKCHGCELGHPTAEFYSGDKFQFSYIIKYDSSGSLEDIFQCVLTTGFVGEPEFDFEYFPSYSESNYEKMAKKYEQLDHLRDAFDLDVEQ